MYTHISSQNKRKEGTLNYSTQCHIHCSFQKLRLKVAKLLSSLLTAFSNFLEAKKVVHSFIHTVSLNLFHSSHNEEVKEKATDFPHRISFMGQCFLNLWDFTQQLLKGTRCGLMWEQCGRKGAAIYIYIHTSSYLTSTPHFQQHLPFNIQWMLLNLLL